MTNQTPLIRPYCVRVARISSFERKSTCLLRFSAGLLLGITFFVPFKLLGAEQIIPQIEQAVPQTPKIDSFDSIEAPRNYLSGKITSFANHIDRFFGGDRHYQESNQTVLQLNLSRMAGFDGDHKFDLAARLNFRLPITEGRMHLLLETDPEKYLTDEPAPVSAVIRDKVVVPKSVALATRYAAAATEEDIWHFSTDAGLKFPIPINPFVRARGSYSAPLGNEWRLKASESAYWFNTLGAGATTQLDLERKLSTLLLFRSSSTFTWLNDKQNLDMRQDFSVYYTLNDRTALLYQASAIGVSNPAFAATDYVVLMMYRYRLHREWLFFELSPQLHFPQVMKYHSSPALSMRLEVLFDESR